MTVHQVTTSCGGDMIEVLEVYSGTTRDIIIAARELCRAAAAGVISEGKAENTGKDWKWSVEVRK